MNVTIDRQFDFSGGVQAASSWMLRRPNEVEDSKNAVFNVNIGGIDRRKGYVQEGDTIETGNSGLGLHESKFDSGAETLVAINNTADDATTVRYYDNGTGNYTSFITDLPVNSKVNIIDHLSEAYLAGMTTDTEERLAIKNIQSDHTVSESRNLYTAPKARFIAEYGGSLYAMNVQIGADIYPDRAYKSSAPTGAVTYVKGAQDDVLTDAVFVDNVPPMTSNTAPSGVAAASSEANANTQAWTAFDNNSTGTTNRWVSNSTTTGWIRYDFGASNSKIITHYSVVGINTNDGANVNRAPKTWTLQGSNDASSWTTIDTQTAVAAWTAGEKRTYATSNTTAYRYYRLNITLNQGDATYVSVGEIEFLTSTTGAQSIELAVDSVRYVKQGMVFDIYAAGTDTFLQSVTVDSVDRPNNKFVFTPYTLSFATSDVNTSTEVITLSSAAAFPTGAAIKFDSSGAVPAGLTANTKYYSIYVSSTTIKVATSLENALLGVAINLTSTGSGTHRIRSNYDFDDNDELWLHGRHGELSILWNTDYPTEATADFLRIPPGLQSDNDIVGWGKSNNRLFFFTKTSMFKWDKANLITVSENVGCANHESIATKDDWMFWLDSEARVHARNDSTGQEEIISKQIKQKYLDGLTSTNLSQASAGIIDNVYKLSLGQTTIDENLVYLRVCYDFDMNTWAPETHTRPQLFMMNSDMSGKMRMYFLDNTGKMFLDEEGYLDDTATIPWEVEIGNNHSGTESKKHYTGCYVFGDNLPGTQYKFNLDDKDPITEGELTERVSKIPFAISGQAAEGRYINSRFTHNSNSIGPTLYGLATYSATVEDNFG